MPPATKSKPKVRRLRSECGLYFAEEDKSDPRYTLRYSLFDRAGNFVCTSTYWSNRGTSTRIGFEIGSGSTRATFSYPRYPTWYRRRWVCCFDIKLDDLTKLVEQFGGKVIVGFKPCLNVSNHIGFRATPEQSSKIDDELTRRCIKWNGPPCKGGQWDINCPSSERWPDGRTEGENDAASDE